MTLIDRKGAMVPALGLGTWQLNGAQCTRMVSAALDMGYRHIDTAQAYENEAEVGAGLAAAGVPREQVFLTTKVWMSNLAGDRLIASTEDSLRRLGTDFVDLLLLHWPSEEVPMAESLEALHRARERGLARHIGVSNYTVALLTEAIEAHGADLLCNQVEYHPLLSQQPLLQAMRVRNMVLTAYSPLGRGRALKSAEIRQVAEKHGRTPAQVALRWLIEQDGVAVIPKAASEGHARANLGVFDFTLDDDDRATIATINRDRRLIDPSWSPAWDA